jgi:cytosine/adenosine deaminase-related metal-dependent hydrolase
MSDRLAKMFGEGRKALKERLGPNVELDKKRHIHWFAGRYISHIEDDPLISSTRHDDIGEAMQRAYDQVAYRLIENGCGDGLVFDTFTDQIVSVFGAIRSCTVDGEDILSVGVLPMPDAGRQEQMRFLVRSWDRQLRGDDVHLPLVWPKCS